MTRPLNATAASLLGFLHAGPMTGWDLVATAQARIGGYWTVTRSQVYRELAAMADAGLVEAGETGAREKRPYSLTAAGRRAFADWVVRDPPGETIRFPLLLTIAFGRHVSPEQLARFVHRHRAVHAARLAAYDELGAVAGELDDYARATLDFGRHYERAVLAWFDELPESVRGTQPWEDTAGR